MRWPAHGLGSCRPACRSEPPAGQHTAPEGADTPIRRIQLQASEVAVSLKYATASVAKNPKAEPADPADRAPAEPAPAEPVDPQPAAAEQAAAEPATASATEAA